MARNDWKRVRPIWEIGEKVRARFPNGGWRKSTIIGFPSDTWQKDDAGARITVQDTKGNVEQVHFGSIYIEPEGAMNPINQEDIAK